MPGRSNSRQSAPSWAIAARICSISNAACSAPPTRARIARASSSRPCLTSQRGLSGTRNRKPRKSNAGRVSEANIHRQPTETFQASSSADAICQFTMETTSIPKMIVIWFSDTNRPRSLAGDTSAIYRGESIEAAPTARPPSIRAATNSFRFLGNAEPTAEIANTSAASWRILLRPKRSLSAPANAAPIMQPMSTLETAQPFRTEFN